MRNREAPKSKRSGGNVLEEETHRKLSWAKCVWPEESCYPASSVTQKRRRPDQNRNKVQRDTSQTGAAPSHVFSP